MEGGCTDHRDRDQSASVEDTPSRDEIMELIGGRRGRMMVILFECTLFVVGFFVVMVMIHDQMDTDRE